jgi:hypothetical protein
MHRLTYTCAEVSCAYVNGIVHQDEFAFSRPFSGTSAVMKGQQHSGMVPLDQLVDMCTVSQQSDEKPKTPAH